MDESTLLSIKQFSSFSGLNLSTLRYYDEMGILPPASRGEENNYRYYSPQQIIIANFIQVLVEMGVPLSTIKELSSDRTPDKLIMLLGQQEDKLDYLFNQLRTAYSIIHTYRRNILNGSIAEDGLIRLEKMSDMNYEIGPENNFTDKDESFYEQFIQFCKSAGKYKINLKYPIGALHYDMDRCLKNTGKPDMFISLDPFGSRTRPAGTYLIGYTHGYYGQFGDLAQRMAEFAGERGLFFHGPVFTVYLHDEICVTDPNEYLSRLSVLVSKKKTAPARRKGAGKDDFPPKKLANQIRRSIS